jgi:hypothetical protein
VGYLVGIEKKSEKGIPRIIITLSCVATGKEEQEELYCLD